ncbi:hypothetical protein [Deinococcus petrolearius]
MTAAERGSKGGKTTVQRHGSTHMECIGRAGLYTTAERYYGGDVHAYMEALRDRQRRGEFDPRLGCQVQRSA